MQLNCEPMKKLLILLMIISIKCFGQSSIHFVDSTATWNVAKSYPHADIQHPSFVETVTKVYGFDGDTLINGNLYNKIHYTSDSNFFLNKTFLGNLREENGFVIFIDSLSTVDTIYNFNLNIGDSVLYNLSGIGSQYITISAIDSINIDNNYYKVFHFTEPNFPPLCLKELWIEGIGSIHGPLFPANPTLFETELPDSMNLTCYKKNDTVKWSNPFYNDCFINIVLSINDSQKSTADILIFPNPVTNELTINLPKNNDCDYTISIFDLTGKIVFKQNYESIDNTVINTSELTNSFYLMQIKLADKIYWTNFIKQ